MKTFKELEVGDLIYYINPDKEFVIGKIYKVIPGHNISYRVKKILGTYRIDDLGLYIRYDFLDKCIFPSYGTVYTDESLFLERFQNENIQ